MSLDGDSHYRLTAEQIEFYQKSGYIKLKQVLGPETLAHYGKFIWE